MSVPKIINVGGNLTKLWQIAVFLRHGVYRFICVAFFINKTW